MTRAPTPVPFYYPLAGATQPGWLAVPKRTARAGRPWPARVARAAQPGGPGRPASVLGAPCFESPGVRSTRGPPWATWSTRVLLSLAACRQQRLAAMAVEGARKTPEDGARAGAQSPPQPAALEEEPPSGLRRPPAPPKEEVRIHVPPATSVCPLPASQTPAPSALLFAPPSPRRSTRASSRSRTSAPTGPSPPRRPRACRGCRAAERRC